MSAPAGEDELRQLVAESGQILDVLGLVDYLGHTSARVPGTDRIVVKPKHSPTVRSMRTLTAGDMIVVDLDGNLLEGTDAPPSEVYIHTEIYRARPDIASIVHTHQPASTTMGLVSAELQPLLHVPAAFAHGEMPIWECPLLVNDQSRGRELASALGGARFCHLQGHGVVVVGDSVQHATVTTVQMEVLAEANLRVMQTGLTPRLITSEELADLRGSLAGPLGRWEYYRELVELRG